MSVDVLLVRTHSPGNLGSAARACKAFGARLLLLHPRADAAHEDAEAFSSGAGDLLASAPRLSSLEEAAGEASALLAWAATAGPPVLYYTAFLYTEVPAAFATALALRLLLPTPGGLASQVGLGLVAALVIVTLAVLLPAYQISREEPALAMRE